MQPVNCFAFGNVIHWMKAARGVKPVGLLEKPYTEGTYLTPRDVPSGMAFFRHQRAKKRPAALLPDA